MGICEIGNFKGNRVLIIKDSAEDKYPFTIGFVKAKKILAHIDDIRNFVGEEWKHYRKY